MLMEWGKGLVVWGQACHSVSVRSCCVTSSHWVDLRSLCVFEPLHSFVGFCPLSIIVYHEIYWQTSYAPRQFLIINMSISTPGFISSTLIMIKLTFSLLLKPLFNHKNIDLSLCLSLFQTKQVNWVHYNLCWSVSVTSIRVNRAMWAQAKDAKPLLKEHFSIAVMTFLDSQVFRSKTLMQRNQRLLSFNATKVVTSCSPQAEMTRSNSIIKLVVFSPNRSWLKVIS